MINIKERVVPGISPNYLIQESLSRYIFFKRLINGRANVLDIGCGTGYGTAMLHKPKTKVFGLDIDKKAVRYATTRYSKFATFDLGSAVDLPYLSNSFKFVCSFEVIEHLSQPKKFLKEVVRILARDGVFILSTPNKIVHSPKGIESSYHIKEYTAEEFKKLLSKYFSKISVYGQFKTRTAKESFSYFLQSQQMRQRFVDFDLIGIRKLFPRMVKEKIWIKTGAVFGRSFQDRLKPDDFPILNSNINEAEYLIALCIKSR